MNQPPPGDMPVVHADDGSIYLRPLVESDVTERYLSWFRDDVATRYLEAKNLSKDDVIEYLRWGKTTRQRTVDKLVRKGASVEVAEEEADEQLGFAEQQTALRDERRKLREERIALESRKAHKEARAKAKPVQPSCTVPKFTVRPSDEIAASFRRRAR